MPPPLRKHPGDRNWLLPRGGWAEQVGERLTDRVLVWADNGTSDLQTKLGPECHVRRIATNLFVAELAGVREVPSSAGAPPDIKPLDRAKNLLDAARNAKDCPKQASALIDLGVIHLREGQIRLALDLLTRALTIARKFNDSALISDAQTNLARALLAAGHTDKARQLLEVEVAKARASTDRFHEKLALGYLAGIQAKLGDRCRTVELYETTLELARQLGDRRHQAELLWQLAIHNAEAGEREQALAYGLEAVHIMEKITNPSAREFAKHLEQYRLTATTKSLQVTAANGAPQPGYSQVISLEVGVALPSNRKEMHGSSLLRMAASAAKAATRYVGSGLKRVPTTTYKRRLEVCATCPNHTGVRCKACGCLTSIKAWLPHEKCPTGAWPE